jgi:outer membrane protein assembly factor BamA
MPDTDTVNGKRSKLYADYTYLGNAFQETIRRQQLSPRLSVGFGVNWNSPFGPFRIDIAKALLKATRATTPNSSPST